MVNSHVTLLAQAKQGDANAIATLLNHKLQSKGITAKASVKNSCLQIMLEAVKTPPQQPLVEFIRKSFSGFTVDAWHTVKVYGRRVGEEIPDWVEDFKTQLESVQNPVTLAKQGNIKAISTLINQQLYQSGITAKVSSKGTCLQIMVEAVEIPSQQQMVPLLKAEILKLDIQSIAMLRLYGKQSEEDFPDWQEEVNLTSDTENPKETQLISADLSLSSKAQKENSDLVVVQEIDNVGLSNQLYTALQTTCYQHLAHKVASEDNKSIHEIVEHFSEGLESDLRLELEQFAEQMVNITKPFGIQLNLAKVQNFLSDATTTNFAGVRLAIRELERVTQEVRQTDFPQETDELKSFFTGAAQEFTANMFGASTMSDEAIIGATIGLVAGPLGSAVGGLVGGWVGGENKRKALEALLEKYQKAREKVFQEWGTVLQIIYTKSAEFLAGFSSSSLLTWQTIRQAIEFYNIGNERLSELTEGLQELEGNPQEFIGVEKGEIEEKVKEERQEILSIYDQSISLNPGFAPVWNNKGLLLSQLGNYEEALESLDQAIKIDGSLGIAFENRGDILRELGSNEEAIKAYEQSMNLDPEHRSGWPGKCYCLCILQRYEEALKVCDTSVSLQPENFLGWYSKAYCLALMGDNDKALENLREAVRLNSKEVQKLAKTDSDFNNLREDDRFKELMESSVGISYAMLKKFLREKQWKEADQETAHLIVSVIEKVTDLKEVNRDSLMAFPCVDLETIDKLWQENSDGKFGFSIQKEVFQQGSKNRNEFGNQTGWRICDTDGSYSWRGSTSFDYDFTTAPKGHLPSSLWAGEDGWFENRRDRLIFLFTRMESCGLASPEN